MVASRSSWVVFFARGFFSLGLAAGFDLSVIADTVAEVVVLVSCLTPQSFGPCFFLYSLDLFFQLRAGHRVDPMSFHFARQACGITCVQFCNICPLVSHL